jgi:hypothetical protein
MSTDEVVDGVTRFRQRLLPQTLDHGRQIDFYRCHWGAAAASSDIRLADLPTVSKAKHRPELEAMRHPKLRPMLLLQTSGTTGLPFRQFRSAEELDAYREYVQARMAKANGATASRPLLAFNAIPSHLHGASVDASQLAHRISIDTWSETGLKNAISLLGLKGLFQHEDVTPVRALSAAPRMLVSLTAACELRGIEPAEFGIDDVYSVSDLLTGSTRRYLSQRWVGSNVRDVFSCSEITGAAGECETCHGYHYEPTVWPEVLDLELDQPSQDGIGELTLTELYPFAQFQPMLRYRTGDVVRRLACPDRPGDLAFMPLGRRRSCPSISIDNRTHVLIGGAGLREILEDDPGVARSAPMGVDDPVISRLPIGLPRAIWTVQDDGEVTRFELNVEAAFSVGLHPRAAADLQERLTERLTDSITVPKGRSVAVQVIVREPYSDLLELSIRPGAVLKPSDTGAATSNA